ncbi:hypothetical protein RvY_03576-1 [Ramazzottius varieornatus]|uniref:Uncharacterized protein n=1 Tax=Ramazzottius varieornatus TaxID=947166 RepID=A0A1D1UNL2_RAMVA|nr:hypothetical protein RvY_03576-1 [Ramazzottius varieornatus]
MAGLRISPSGCGSWFALLMVTTLLVSAVVPLPVLAAASGQASYFPSQGLEVPDEEYVRPPRLFAPFNSMSRIYPYPSKRKGVGFYAFGGKRDAQFSPRSEVRGRTYFAWGGKKRSAAPSVLHMAQGSLPLGSSHGASNRNLAYPRDRR